MKTMKFKVLYKGPDYKINYRGQIIGKADWWEVRPDFAAGLLGVTGKCNFLLLPNGELRLRAYVGGTIQYAFFPLDANHYKAVPIDAPAEGPDYLAMVAKMLPFLEEYNHSSQFHKCADPECLVCKELGKRHAELKAVLAEVRACMK